MFTENPFTEPTELSTAIDNCITALNDVTPGTEDYDKIVDQLVKLYKLKEIDLKLDLQDKELTYKLNNQDTDRELKENELNLRENEHQQKIIKDYTDAQLKADELKQKEEELKLKREVFEADEEMRKLEVEDKKRAMKIPFGIKPETLALIGANLAGIAIIVGHERLHVVATKAVGFVTKLKN